MEIYNGTYCVYVHINKINNKKYIGQTKYGDDPNKRWRNGLGYEDSTYFYIKWTVVLVGANPARETSN